MRVAIFNNYKYHLFTNPQPSGIRNVIGYSDNIGNIVFLESISRELGADSISIYDFILNYKSYEDRYDMIVLSLANMISPNYKLSEDFMTALENTKIPICIFSIGVQAYNEEELYKNSLSLNVRRILNLSKKSGTTIGLRGEITKEFLDGEGIKNTQVIGCPSLFYKKSIPVKNNVGPKEILLSASFGGSWKNPLLDIFKFGYDYCKSYLVQSESRILFDKYKISEGELDSWNISNEKKSYLMNRGYDYSYYCHPNLDSSNLGKWLIENSVFFNDFDMWLDSMSVYDMHIGARFHGSVMSTLAGVPTLILEGDLRVKEFVELHGLPNINIFDFNEEMKPKYLYDMIDYQKYENRYDSLKSNYIDYLNKNGLRFII